VGKPVFDGQGVGGSGTSEEEERVERMKRLEEQWAKQKRPKDVSRISSRLVKAPERDVPESS